MREDGVNELEISEVDSEWKGERTMDECERGRDGGKMNE